MPTEPQDRDLASPLRFRLSQEAEVRNRKFNEKTRRELEGLVILKPLTRWNEAYKEFPRFVLEYLVAGTLIPTTLSTVSEKSTAS